MIRDILSVCLFLTIIFVSCACYAIFYSILFFPNIYIYSMSFLCLLFFYLFYHSCIYSSDFIHVVYTFLFSLFLNPKIGFFINDKFCMTLFLTLFSATVSNDRYE